LPGSIREPANSSKRQNGSHVALKISPTLRTGVGSTAGAKDGRPGVDSGPVAAKRQKMAWGKIPQVSSNLDGARCCAKSLHPATAKAAVEEKGPEVIPSDNNDKKGDESTLTMPTKPHKGGWTTPVGKTSSAGRTAPGKAAKPRLGAAYDKMRAVARAGMPTATHLTMDDNDEDVDIAMAIEHGLARVTALGNDRKGCRCCLVLPRRKFSRGKPDSAEALPNFCWPKEASTKKRLLSPMASVGGGVIIKGRQC
jgi:hypothetical protein